MNNNDYLIRLRYALDLKDSELIQIFALGGEAVSNDKLALLMTKKEAVDLPDEPLSKKQLESFLNGLIIYKRGAKPDVKPTFIMTDSDSINNVFIKKIKIALALTSDDILDIFRLAQFNVSAAELTAILRKAGQRNYQPAGNQFTRNFIKGLTVKYRNL
ncbi:MULTISPECIES: DUF1456 family protein [unclassified Enterococcus]|uniref:DUF1456 family protein n=1 Tax=unclassified Enterococcus TaxID=2608891 RepID=UPI001554F888|nr:MULTISPECIES: DUF1456 family protein [unclassified Enterococcus]MBS7576469.1 DUF1456 family protein [Enterococcus sp. MMGLQ5-2]MBS7583701.1 DUF1456 family protein [Enterococcus sp. MMGLQ5-1]NPD11562.1 DUF1456 family protein [Enterococcus sp. MMGLQ5-1]NPD36306.1 DUF1456 family protein [Enterococcus sp. MMGLQ5-2]